jgi:hypothetical protein
LAVHSAAGNSAMAGREKKVRSAVYWVEETDFVVHFEEQLAPPLSR